MGFRVIELPADGDPSIRVFLEQLSAFAESRGLEAYLDGPNADQRYELTLEGNSSFLNDLTPTVAEAALLIAADIDPNAQHLLTLAGRIARQLEEQITAPPTITSARSGREFAERVHGDSGHRHLLAELEVHLDRVATGLAEYGASSGPNGWRERDRAELCLRVDGLSLLAAARRFLRVADDLAARIGGSHLAEAVDSFRSDTNGMVTIRDISEHIDEYGIGVGRRDGPAVEPGQAIDVTIDPNEVWLSALSARVGVLKVGSAVKSLASCLEAATDYHTMFHTFPFLADLDFIAYDEGGRARILGRDEEDDEMKGVRELAAKIEPATPGAVACPNCGMDL